MMVFGLGSGRCGTVSLAGLLCAQPGTVVFHEMNPASMAWQGAQVTVDQTLDRFGALFRGEKPQMDVYQGEKRNPDALAKLAEAQQVVRAGDVALYYLPYVEYIIGKYPEAKFVALRRDEEQTVQSYLKKTRVKRSNLFSRLVNGKYKPVNNWMDHDGKQYATNEMWHDCYPKYEASDKEEALHLYWKDYYKQVIDLVVKFPENICLWEMEALNSEESQQEILDFIGVPRADQILKVGIRKNAKMTKTPTGEQGQATG